MPLLTLPLPDGFHLIRQAYAKYDVMPEKHVFIRHNGYVYKIIFVITTNNLRDFSERTVVEMLDDGGHWTSLIDKSYVDSVAGRVFTGKETEEREIHLFFDSAIQAIRELRP